VLTVGDDDYNHDVNPIKKGGSNPTQQGGNVYAYVERGRATKTSMRNFPSISSAHLHALRASGGASYVETSKRIRTDPHPCVVERLD